MRYHISKRRVTISEFGARARRAADVAMTWLLGMLGIAIALSTASCNGSSAEAAAPPPPPTATVVNNTRAFDPSTGSAVNNDFERVFFLKTTLPPVTNIGKTSTYQSKLIQARAFMSATVLYQPSLPAIDIAHFVGGDDTNPSGNDLVAMRCRPTTPSQLQANVASWPNVFADASADLAKLMGYTPADCPTANLDPSFPVDQRVYCASQAFSDQKNITVPLVLQNSINTGVTEFQFTGTAFLPTGSTTGANVLFDLYGIGSGFSGLGYSVANSFLASSGNVALTAAQALEQSVVTEYLVNNVPLADADCRCVRVTPFDGRDQSLLNWNRVWSRGRLASDGSCVTRATMP